MSQAFEDIRRSLSSEDWQERHRTIEQLSKNESPELIDFLKRHLHDPDINVRNAVKTIFIRIGNAALIRDKLYDSDHHVRIAAVNVLGQIADRKSLPWLLDLLKKETNPNVRLSIIDTFKGFQGEEVGPAVLSIYNDLHEEEKLPFIYLLSDIRADLSSILPTLYDAFSNDLLRPAIIRALGAFGDANSLRFLLTTLDDSNTFIFSGAILAIARILERDVKASESIAGLLERLGKGERRRLWERIASLPKAGKDYLTASLSVLRVLGKEESLPEILELLHDYRSDVVECLAVYARETPQYLLPYLEAKDPLVRGAIGLVLAKEGDAAIARTVARTLIDEDNVDALRSKLLGLYHRGDPSISDAILDAAEEILHKPELAAVKGDLEATIVSLGVETCAKRCRHYLTQKGAIAEFALAVLARSGVTLGLADVRPFVDSPDAEVRKNAALCLGRVHRKESVMLLAKMANDNSTVVRKHVATALGGFSDGRSLKALLRLQEDREEAVACAAMLSLARRRYTGSLKLWSNYLQIPPNGYARTAVLALGLLRTRRAMEALRDYFEKVKLVNPDFAEEISRQLKGPVSAHDRSGI